MVFIFFDIVVTSTYLYEAEMYFNCEIVVISKMWQTFSQEIAFRNRDKYNKYCDSGIRTIFCCIQGLS